MSQVGCERGQLLGSGGIPQQGIAALAVVSSWPIVIPAVSWWACSAASIISVRRRMSRCIDRPGLGQD
jgi:hypothetical protein